MAILNRVPRLQVCIVSVTRKHKWYLHPLKWLFNSPRVNHTALLINQVIVERCEPGFTWTSIQEYPHKVFLHDDSRTLKPINMREAHIFLDLHTNRAVPYNWHRALRWEFRQLLPRRFTDNKAWYSTTFIKNVLKSQGLENWEGDISPAQLYEKLLVETN